MKDQWTQVEHYVDALLAPSDDAITAALEANREAGLPSIDVPASLGKFLAMLIEISGARRVLEVGTLGAYSTIWMARALPADGRLVTLELEPRNAEIARTNLARAGVLDRVEIRLGPAVDTMRAMSESSPTPFDFIFLDADKKSLPAYLEWSLKLSHPGTLIVADNVVRDGKVLDRHTSDADIQGVRHFLDAVAAHPRLSGTAFQTVGARGYDGFALLRVLR
ncbi:MAG: O-methyltransferase [Acidobacteriota bacterium]